jgi:hypothetical protein
MHFDGDRPAALWASGAGDEPTGGEDETAAADSLSVWSAPPTLLSTDDAAPHVDAGAHDVGDGDGDADVDVADGDVDVADVDADTGNDGEVLDPTPVQSSLSADPFSDLDDGLPTQAFDDTDAHLDASVDGGATEALAGEVEEPPHTEGGRGRPNG